MKIIKYIRITEILSEATSIIDGDLLTEWDKDYNRMNLAWCKVL